MPLFVHLTSDKNIGAMRRGGIRSTHGRGKAEHGVFAMPVLPDFYVTHQWLREMKRSGQRSICGVYFQVPDDEPVMVGHYGKSALQLTAAQASATIASAEDPLGYEVLLLRKILPGEIRRVRRLPQLLGWRYYPKAHGRRPCGCPVCQPRGEIKAHRIRERYEADFP